MQTIYPCAAGWQTGDFNAGWCPLKRCRAPKSKGYPWKYSPAPSNRCQAPSDSSCSLRPPSTRGSVWSASDSGPPSTHGNHNRRLGAPGQVAPPAPMTGQGGTSNEAKCLLTFWVHQLLRSAYCLSKLYTVCSRPLVTVSGTVLLFPGALDRPRQAVC